MSGGDEWTMDHIVDASGRTIGLSPPRCETCRHWERSICTRVTDSSVGASIDADLYEDWAMKADPATLVTDADFGCVLHAPADPEDPR